MHKTTWSADGTSLTVGADVMAYALQGNKLLLTMGSVQIAWKKLAGPGKKAAQKPKAGAQARPAEKKGAGSKPARDKAKPAAGGNTQDAQVRAVLTGSAWCSFTYNQLSGTSTTRKVVFRTDGVLLMTDGAETYSSGYGGVAAGQSGSSGALRWKLENLRVYIDQGGGFQDIRYRIPKWPGGGALIALPNTIAIHEETKACLIQLQQANQRANLKNLPIFFSTGALAIRY